VRRAHAVGPVGGRADLDARVGRDQAACLVGTRAQDDDHTLTARVDADEAGDSLVLAVSDTGIGIPSDKLEEVFESFRQVDSSTTRAYSGRLGRAAPTPYLLAWREPGSPPPAPYPQQRELVRRWRQGSPTGLDRANHWAGQSAAMATAEPAGDIVTRIWREALRLLP